MEDRIFVKSVYVTDSKSKRGRNKDRFYKSLGSMSFSGSTGCIVEDSDVITVSGIGAGDLRALLKRRGLSLDDGLGAIIQKESNQQPLYRFNLMAKDNTGLFDLIAAVPLFSEIKVRLCVPSNKVRDDNSTSDIIFSMYKDGNARGSSYGSVHIEKYISVE